MEQNIASGDNNSNSNEHKRHKQINPSDWVSHKNFIAFSIKSFYWLFAMFIIL